MWAEFIGPGLGINGVGSSATIGVPGVNSLPRDARRDHIALRQDLGTWRREGDRLDFRAMRFGHLNLLRRICVIAGVALCASALAGLTDPVPTAPVFSRISLIIVATTAAMVIGCVLIQYETFRFLTTGLAHLHTYRRQKIVVLVLALIALHIVEIWLFGLAYYASCLMTLPMGRYTARCMDI